jgi:hypothetical protein
VLLDLTHFTDCSRGALLSALADSQQVIIHPNRLIAQRGKLEIVWYETFCGLRWYGNFYPGWDESGMNQKSSMPELEKIWLLDQPPFDDVAKRLLKLYLQFSGILCINKSVFNVLGKFYPDRLSDIEKIQMAIRKSYRAR